MHHRHVRLRNCLGEGSDSVTVCDNTANADDEEPHPEDGVSSSIKAPEARDLHIQSIKKCARTLR